MGNNHPELSVGELGAQEISIELSVGLVTRGNKLEESVRALLGAPRTLYTSVGALSGVKTTLKPV